MGVEISKCDGVRVSGTYYCWPTDKAPLKVRACLVNLEPGPDFAAYFSRIPQNPFPMTRISSYLYQYTFDNWILSWELGSDYSLFGWYHATLGRLADSNIADRCSTKFWSVYYRYHNIIHNIGAVVMPCSDDFEGVSLQSLAKEFGVPIQSGVFADAIGIGGNDSKIRFADNRGTMNVSVNIP